MVLLQALPPDDCIFIHETISSGFFSLSVLTKYMYVCICLHVCVFYVPVCTCIYKTTYMYM